MTKAEFERLHAAACAKMQAITKAKNNDYTGKTDDPFYNFRLCELMGICSVETGLLVRMLDKIARLHALSSGAQRQVADEKIEDTALDLANYGVIFGAYRQSKESNSESDNTALAVVGSRPVPRRD